MEDKKKINKDGLKYLITLGEMEEVRPSATKVAKKFGVNRSTVWRALAEYVEYGFLLPDFQFTNQGRHYIELCLGRKQSFVNVLVSKGMSHEKANHNAMALLCSLDDEATEMLARSINKFYESRKIKLQKENKKSFLGSHANEYLRIGNYTASFMFLKMDKNKQEQVSMANEGFRHPATMVVSTNKSYLCLRLIMVERQSRFGNKFLRGRLSGMKYEFDKILHQVKIHDNCAYIPLEAFRFLYVKEDDILQGKAELIMSCSVGSLNMPESKAILTIYC